jgi:hypothetical protein
MSNKKKINKYQTNEDMQFDGPSRPDPSVERSLSTRDTSFKKVDFPDTGEGYSNYEELLASDQYKNALNKLSEFTGVSDIGVGTSETYGQLSMRAFGMLSELIRAETGKEGTLIKLCERMMVNMFPELIKRNRNGEPVLDQEGKPMLKVQFDFKFKREGSSFQKPKNKQELEQKEEELTNDFNDGDLDLERAKRRLANALTQGSSIDATYAFKKFENIVTKVIGVPNVVEKYGFLVSTMMLGYWQYDESMLSSASSSGKGAAGKTRVDTSTNPPTIHAEAVVFPFLIHEAVKGIMEYLAIPKSSSFKSGRDIELYKSARELEDQVIHEIWDIRLGPAIWRKLIKQFPRSLENNVRKRFFEKRLQTYIYVNILNLERKEFLLLFKEIMGETEDGKRLLGAMFYDISGKLKGDEVTKSTSYFRKEMDEFMKKHGNDDSTDDDISDFLSQMGIRLN